MEEVQLKTKKWMDKTEWGDGEWQNEPDRVSWIDPDTGLPCIIRRGHSGSWCGYVGVSKGHPLFAKSYWNLDEIEVHGGLTFSAMCDGDTERGVCHEAEEDAWWFGFDCAHAGDYMPALEASLARAMEVYPSPELQKWRDEHPDEYWTMSHVMKEVHYLAGQLAKLAKGER